MNVISRHIKYLLLGSGSVAVPGLGVFVAGTRSASYSEESSMFSAPSDVVSFTPCPDSCDKGLAESICRASGVDCQEAEAIIARDVESVMRSLALNGSCSIAGFGRFVRNTENDEIGFEASPSLRSGAPAAWLPALEISPLPVRKQAQEPAHDYAAEMNRQSMTRLLRRTASSAAVIALLAVIAFFASQVPATRHAAPKTASLGIERITSGTAARDIDMEEPENPDKALVLILNTPSDGMCVVEPKVPAVKEHSTEELRYCLVVASLASRTEAEKFIDSSEDPLTLLEKDGRFRVYALAGSTIDEVQKLADANGLFGRYPSAWICRK